MEKVTVGQRVTISCCGLTVTGTVISADHETRYHNGVWKVIGYLLEVRSDAGRVHYWKSLIDGGTLTIEQDPSEQVIEVRIRTAHVPQRWQDLPAQTWRCETADEAQTFCRVLLRNNPQALELRWNWQGS